MRLRTTYQSFTQLPSSTNGDGAAPAAGGADSKLSASFGTLLSNCSALPASVSILNTGDAEFLAELAAGGFALHWANDQMTRALPIPPELPTRSSRAFVKARATLDRVVEGVIVVMANCREEIELLGEFATILRTDSGQLARFVACCERIVVRLLLVLDEAGHIVDEARRAELLAEAVARDMEEVAINGDTASADPFLATMDGILKQAASNIVDAAGTPITKDLLRDLLKTLPAEYLRDKKAMRFLSSVDADLSYRNTLADRATVAGDRLLEEDTPVLYSGVPVQPIPLFPENLGVGGDQTAVVLCNPKNINVGIWRQIRFETDRDISEGTLKIVATLRFDVKLAEETGVAKAINVQL